MALGDTAVSAFARGLNLSQQYRQSQQQQERAKRQEQRAQDLFELRRDEARLSMEQTRSQMQNEKAQRLFNSLNYALENNQPISPDLASNLNKVTDGALMRAYASARTPQQRSSAELLSQLASGQSDLDLNSPEVLAAANTTFSSELLEGVGERFKRDGKTWTIRKKFINAIVPGKDENGSIMLDLAVQAVDENGNTKTYDAPATEGRDAVGGVVRDIPLEAAIQKVMGVRGMSRMIESNPEFRSALEQMMVANGVQVAPDQTVSLKEVKAGDEIITYAITEDGERTELARAPRWKSEDEGGAKTSSYRLSDSVLQDMFADQLDAQGNAFLSDETKDDYIEATRQAARLIDNGMNPLAAAHQAYRKVSSYTLPGPVHEQIGTRVQAQLNDMRESGTNYSNGLFSFEKFGGLSRSEADKGLTLAYESYYKKHGELPDGYINPPWGEDDAQSADTQSVDATNQAARGAAAADTRFPNRPAGPQGAAQPARQADAGQGSAAYPDGTRLRGPDGNIYVVRDGRPVLEGQ